MRTFGGFHPAVLFVYYILALCVTMLTKNPVLLALSFAGAFLLYAAQNPVRKWAGDLIYDACLFLLIAVVNPLFSHNGKTILFFMNDNPVTLEAVWYGMANAGMIVAVLFWCKVYYQIMTTDKWVCLFGRPFPKLSMLISLSVRFFPLLARQTKRVRQAQTAMGMYASDSITDRILFSARAFDSVLGWMLENSVDTADGMEARGYGLPGRSSFSVFLFTRRDAVFLALSLVFAAVAAIGGCAGAFSFTYYPSVSEPAPTPLSVLAFAAAALLLMLPFVTETAGNVHWKLRLIRVGKYRDDKNEECYGTGN